MHCQGNKKGGKDFSATPKPCSDNKQPENSKGPVSFLFFPHQQETREASWRRDTVRCRSRGTPLVLLVWGWRGVGWGHKRAKAFIHSERRGKRTAHMPCRPGSGTAGTGRVGGDTRDSEETGRGREGGSGEARGEASARQDGRHLLHHVLGSHGDKTDPHPPLLPPARAALTHHALTAW